MLVHSFSVDQGLVTGVVGGGCSFQEPSPALPLLSGMLGKGSMTCQNSDKS